MEHESNCTAKMKFVVSVSLEDSPIPDFNILATQSGVNEYTFLGDTAFFASMANATNGMEDSTVALCLDVMDFEFLDGDVMNLSEDSMQRLFTLWLIVGDRLAKIQRAIRHKEAKGCLSSSPTAMEFISMLPALMASSDELYEKIVKLFNEGEDAVKFKRLFLDKCQDNTLY